MNLMAGPAGKEDVDRVRIGGLRLREVGAEILRLSERRIRLAGNGAAGGGESCLERVHHLVSRRVVEGHDERALVALTRHPRTHVAVDLRVGERRAEDPGTALFAGQGVVAGVHDDERRVRPVHVVAHRPGDGRRDDSYHHVDLVAQDELLDLRETGGGLGLGVRLDERDLAPGDLAAQVIEAHLERDVLILAQSPEYPGEGQEHPDLDVRLRIRRAGGSGKQRRCKRGGHGSFSVHD